MTGRMVEEKNTNCFVLSTQRFLHGTGPFRKSIKAPHTEQLQEQIGHKGTQADKASKVSVSTFLLSMSKLLGEAN